MIGEFAFQLFGAKWSGIRLLSGAIAANPGCAVHGDGSFAKFLTGKTATPAEHEQDQERRTKLRIDNFQKACWHRAGETPEVKWGHQTMAEDIGGLLDDAGAQSPAIDNGWAPERGRFNAIDYFVCRCLRVPSIVILRDGRAAIPALIKHDKLTTAAAVARWKFSVHVLKRVVYFTERSYVIRFEDLSRDPKSTIRDVSDFLGIAYNDTMIKDLLPDAKNAALGKDIDPQALAKQTAKEPWAKEISSELEVCGYLE
jgi:hypothetical protein